MGLLTAITADNLLGYAYMHQHVEKALFTFDADNDHMGAMPKITYEITLKAGIDKKYAAVNKYTGKSSLWSKWRLYRLLKSGIPPAGAIEAQIAELAGGYLPKKYQIAVTIKGIEYGKRS